MGDKVITEPNKKKVAMIVSNPCNPDYRVIKQAESLAKNGYEVRIYALKKAAHNVPTHEKINGVVYFRATWNASEFIQRLFMRRPKYIEISELKRDWLDKEDD